jgi:hypothetical protein
MTQNELELAIWALIPTISHKSIRLAIEDMRIMHSHDQQAHHDHKQSAEWPMELAVE